MFSYKYKIVQEDINYGGHVGNERALLFFQFSRMAFFESLGFTELDLGDGKVINVYTMLVCYDYKAKKIKRVPQGFKDKVEALV